MTWARRPIKHVAEVSVSNVDKKSADGEVPVRLVNYTDVYYGDRLTPALPLMEATATSRQVEAFRLRAGDVVITKDSETPDDIGIPAFIESSADDMVLGYHLALLRPRPEAVEPRYLYWAVSSDDARGQLSTGATGVTRFGLRTAAISSTALSLPALMEQRAIADFLDTETARIDALITKKRRMIDLLGERQQASIDGAVEGAGTLISVRHLVDRITSGPRGWSDRTGDHGAPFLRITNVQRTSIALARRELLRVEDPGTAEAVRTRVAAGDVLVSITADIGSVGLATDDDHGGFVSQHIALITPTGCESEWLAYAIKSTNAQQTLDSGQYGGTKTQLSLADIAGLKVPCPSPEIRNQRLRALQAKLASIESAMKALTSQLALLAEHRQALITAAVTGELEAPGVAV